MTSTSTGWIIDRRADLTWLIGSAGASFALLGLYLLLVQGLGLDSPAVAIVLFVAWSLIFDGTHAFATYARTYCDRQFRRDFGPLLRNSLLVFVVGPALLLSFYLLEGVEVARGFSIVFNRFALTFAYYHQVRQHWGFIAAYRKKAGETDLLTRRLDGALLGFGLTYPFLFHHIHYFQPLYVAERLKVGSPAWQLLTTGLLGVAFAAIIAAAILTLVGKDFRRAAKPIGVTGAACAAAAWVTLSMVDLGVNAVLQAFFWLTFAGFVATAATYGVVMARRAAPLNRPKWLLVVVILVTYNLFLLLPLPTLVPLMCLTLFHNIQYHRMVRFYSVNTYGNEEAPLRHGFAATLTRRLFVFGGLALAWSVFLFGPRSAAEILIANEFLNYLIGAFFWGAAFHHYYLDAVIWKLRSPAVSQSLRLTPATAAV